MFKGVIIAEDEFSGVITMNSQEALDAYSEGLCEGANLYGCGSCDLYTLKDLLDLNPDNKYDAKKIAIIKEHLS
jgi:hypothetical protein